MPRTRQNATNAQVKAILNAFAQGPATIGAKRKVGRPRKKMVQEFADATIMPVANGYIVQTTSATGEVYVFPEIDQAFEFIKEKLKPTGEQGEFLAKV